jgi:hypothetical protein
MIKKFLIFFFLYCFSSSVSYAHVGLNYPTGNENFKSGTNIKIQWYIAVDHGECTWNVYFSNDGSNWIVIAENLNKSQLESDWTIPEVTTTFARIKVIQNNFIGIKYEAISGSFTISQTATGVPSSQSELSQYSLDPAYPNPFNSTTKISFSLPHDDHVQLNIYSLTGEKVASLINEDIPAGSHSINWNADGLTSGVYLYSIQIKNFVQTRKVILIK